MQYKLYCNNGLFRHESNDSVTFVTTTDVFDEDTVHSHLPIPKDTLVVMKDIVQNLYGTFVVVNYLEKDYHVKPKYLMKVEE